MCKTIMTTYNICTHSFVAVGEWWLGPMKGQGMWEIKELILGSIKKIINKALENKGCQEREKLN
jgi:hypothetical protein